LFEMTNMKNDYFKIVKEETKFSIYYYEDVSGIEFFYNKEKRMKYELIVNYMPFKAIYSVDNKPVMEFNSKDLLTFEKPEEAPTEDDTHSMVRLDINLINTLSLYGLPERAGVAELKDTYSELYRLYNIDYFKYPKDQYLGLYGSWPFVLGKTYDSLYSGLIWNNPSETYVRVVTNDNNKELLIISESGIIDFSFFSDSDLEYFYFKYHKYIGFMEMPPMLALGYHQSRWNYKDTHDLENVDNLFDEHDIPYDSIWLDIEVI
jgi:alpha-glucosidase (family GH31 glycosyl hydrolase)